MIYPIWGGKIDMRKVRKASKGEVWFRCDPPLGRWILGVGKYTTSGVTLEDALARALHYLHWAAALDGACE